MKIKLQIGEEGREKFEKPNIWFQRVEKLLKMRDIIY